MFGGYGRQEDIRGWRANMNLYLTHDITLESHSLAVRTTNVVLRLGLFTGLILLEYTWSAKFIAIEFPIRFLTTITFS